MLAGRLHKYADYFGKGHADKQAFNLDRNVFALVELRLLRETLVGRSVYRRERRITRQIVNNFKHANLSATEKRNVL